MNLTELRDYNDLIKCVTKDDVYSIRRIVEGVRDRKVIAFFPCRNEEKNLPQVLESLINQTHPFYEIIIVNDASTDRTKEIAEDYGVVVIDLKEKHPSYIGKPQLAELFNKAFLFIYANELKFDYLMQHGGDTVLPRNYVETMIRRMESNKRIVIAGGIIKGEFQYESHVRGLGRFYEANFWNRFIKFYPINYTWESYPLFKALSLGYILKNYPDLVMLPLRNTRLYKEQYGLSMRELGYFPPFAIGKCLLSVIFGRKAGIKMLKSYLFSPSGIMDVSIKNWIRLHQIQRILHPMDSLKIWIKRI
jgi:glycosyltransferase involved in cell wall biosynthesis